MGEKKKPEGEENRVRMRGRDTCGVRQILSTGLKNSLLPRVLNSETRFELKNSLPFSLGTILCPKRIVEWEAIEMAKKLIRLENQKMIGGVCAGFADYLDIDISLVRILFVAVGIISAFIPMILFYIIAWIVIPAGVIVTVKEGIDIKEPKS